MKTVLYRSLQGPIVLFRETFRLFYPRVCPGCSGILEEAENWLCLACHMCLPRTAFGVRKEQAAYRIFAGRVALQHAGSYLYFREGGITREILHAIKYQGQARLAQQLGYLYASELAAQLQPPEVLIPVPMHPGKQRQRGYNQAEKIALGMANAWGSRVETDWLRKTRTTSSQTKASRASRWLNVGERFEARVPEEERQRHIALTDDVLTTGATLEACLQPLVLAGCKTLSIFTLAITETGK
jgi:ComF family protein